jgi:phytoene/squalene synthetase
MISDLNSRFVVCVMVDIYCGILNSIEKNDYDVFSRRACVSNPGKINAILKIILKGEYR